MEEDIITSRKQMEEKKLAEFMDEVTHNKLKREYEIGQMRVRGEREEEIFLIRKQLELKKLEEFKREMAHSAEKRKLELQMLQKERK